MKRLTNFALLSVLGLLTGCGGGAGGEGAGIPGSRSHGVNITGNWQFGTTSTVPGMPPARIAGSVTQSGSSVNGAVHVDGSNCFDQLTTIGLTGTQTGSNVSLTSTSVDGQVITLAGRIANDVLTGAYTITGGCADGDQGSLNGFKVPGIGGTWRIIFDVNEQHVGLGRAALAHGTGSSDGSLGISGTATNSFQDNPICYAGTITSGTFPSPSYMIGTSVNLEIKTVDGGTVSFVGALKRDGEISGSHHVVGGACDGYFGGACLGRNLQASCHVPF